MNKIISILTLIIAAGGILTAGGIFIFLYNQRASSDSQPPEIYGFIPLVPVAGETTSVTILGKNFCSGPSVTLNSASLTVNSSGETSIEVALTSNINSGNIVVTCPSGTATKGLEVSK